MAKKEAIRPPSRAELLRILKDVRRNRLVSPSLEKVRDAALAASNAMTRFEKTNKEYLRLLGAQRRANDRKWELECEKNTQIEQLRNLILLEGPTMRVLKALDQLIHAK